MELEEKEFEKKKIVDKRRGNSEYVASTIYFPRAMDANLKLLAAEQGIPKASYIMKSVNEQIERDSCKDNDSKNLVEIKKIGQEIEALSNNIAALTEDFKLLKSAVVNILDKI